MGRTRELFEQMRMETENDYNNNHIFYQQLIPTEDYDNSPRI